MQIIDKYGYLEDALSYIEKNIVAGRNLQNLARKAGVGEELLKKLSKRLEGFSEKYLLTCLQEELEERHSSLAGAEAEAVLADVKIEVENGKALILVYLNWDIVIDGEREDKTTTVVRIYSGKNIKISLKNV